MFNKGDMGSMKEIFFNLKIKSADLYIMSLLNRHVKKLLNYVTSASAITFPFINTPKIAHYALLLKTFDKRNVVIEYGNYLNKNSERKSTGIIGSCSSNKYRESENNYNYYYLLKDGARFYEIKSNEINGNDESIFNIIGANYYGESLEEFKKQYYSKNSRGSSEFHCFRFNVCNEITLGELVNYFIKDNIWNAKDYNVLTHNCQDFVAECIKILKITRKNGVDKERGREILHLSPCVLKALYDNEGWNNGNTIRRILQRIPIIGGFIQSK